MSRDAKKKLTTRGLKRRKNRNNGKIGDEVKAFLEREVWPHIPPEVGGKIITKLEEEEILGIGPDGYLT